MAEVRGARRQNQASAIRHDILIAARRLFTERGYSGTSMIAIAKEAGTAVQTIYDSIGSKHQIALALNDLIDEIANVRFYGPQAMEAEDYREMLRLFVHITRRINEQGEDIIRILFSAATSEPDIEAAIADGMSRHFSAARRYAGRLHEMGLLIPELTPDRAGIIAGVLTSPQTYQQYVRDHGWTFDECESWMYDSLLRLLIKESS